MWSGMMRNGRVCSFALSIRAGPVSIRDLRKRSKGASPAFGEQNMADLARQRQSASVRQKLQGAHGGSVAASWQDRWSTSVVPQSRDQRESSMAYFVSSTWMTRSSLFTTPHEHTRMSTGRALRRECALGSQHLAFRI